MKLLMIVGQLYPKAGNNAQLMGKLISSLCRSNELRVLTLSSSIGPELPRDYQDLKIDCMEQSLPGVLPVSLYHSVCARLYDPKGNADYLTKLQLLRSLKRVRREYPFDALIVCSEPFPAAAVLPHFPQIPTVLYLMDPPACVCGQSATAYRNRTIWKNLSSASRVLTTPFIHSALLRKRPSSSSRISFAELGFPLVVPSALQPRNAQTDRIALLFTGWMCSDIRSPKYFLEILSRLDERFVVTFMGRDCEKLTERFDIHTKAELITLPQQPYEIALQAMADADIMINIGNSVPVHMPSKTLEYINTGKPFVNFYKLKDCPTLYYTKRYPLCFNMSEDDLDLDQAADQFIDFCVSSKGKTVDRGLIEREYADCTPQYIAKVILDALTS